MSVAPVVRVVCDAGARVIVGGMGGGVPVREVEQNLFAWRRIFLDVEGVRDYGALDVQGCVSDVRFHLFNGIYDARFTNWEARGHEVAADYIQRGVPWFWWVTPTTTSPGLEAVLENNGARRTEAPGMHIRLDNWESSQAPESLELALLSPAAPGVAQTLLGLFGVAGVHDEPMARHAVAFARANTFAVLGTSDGAPVSGGLGLVSDGTLGLYLIATHRDHRGRGFGGAVTERLMAEGKARGAREAVLHSSAMGLSVYRRLGFVEVCDTTQFIWQPAPNSS